MRMKLVPVLALVAFLGCSKSDDQAAIVTVTPGAVAQPEFENATRDFHEALRRDDTEAAMAHVAQDVVMMPPGESVVRGKQAMREWHVAFLTQYRTTSLELADRELFVGNGLAVELGTYAWGLQPIAGGEPFVDHGNYMQVWKQQADGRWQFAREIWNGSVPAAPGAGG